MASLYLQKINAQQRLDLIAKLHTVQNGNCFICDKEIDLDIHKDDIDIDHVIPTAANGKDDPINFAVTHSSCNRSKQDSNLEVARILHRFEKLSELTQKDNRTPNLDDLLKLNSGGQHSPTFSISDGHIKFAFTHLGQNDIIRLPIYDDKQSGFKYFFAVFPIEYLHHDDRINPRTIGKNISKLVKEFYEKRPQLHVALGWIDCQDGGMSPVKVFDGQHKAAAQIMLGSRQIPLRVFVNPDKAVLLAANTNAGTTLKQVAFDKSVQRHLGSTLYNERVARYKSDLSLTDDNYEFSEKDLVKHFKGESAQMRRYILDAIRDTVTHHSDNKLKEYVEFAGKGKERPLSYSTLEKTFYSQFIYQDVLETPIGLNLEEGTNPRQLEKDQLLMLMNIIAEELFIEKFDWDIGGDRIEKRFQDGEKLPLAHIRCCRMSREEIIFNWLKHVTSIVQNHFATHGKTANPEKLFQYQFDNQLWLNIRNYVKTLSELPVWVNSSLSITVFGGKPNHGYWETIFDTGKAPQGFPVLAEPLNLLKMINRDGMDSKAKK